MATEHISLHNGHALFIKTLPKLIPILGRQRQADPCKFKANLFYKMSSRTARAVIQRNPVSKKKQTKTKNKQTYLYLN